MNEVEFQTVSYSYELQSKYAKDFDCGNDRISGFLRDAESLCPSFGQTYVLIDKKKDRIIGYYNITAGSVMEQGNIRMGGAIHINYFAVDRMYQDVRHDNTPIAVSLLADCVNRAYFIQKSYIGCMFISLVATEDGKRLYEKNDFYTDPSMLIAHDECDIKGTTMFYDLDDDLI